jgi:hypothetical protein
LRKVIQEYKNNVEQGIMRLLQKEKGRQKIGCRRNLGMRNKQIANSSNVDLLTEAVSNALYKIISGKDNATVTLQLECAR